MYKSLNQDSQQRIRNIENGFRNHPTFTGYDIRNYRYSLEEGVQALEVSKNGRFVNLFLFFPDFDGKIESIAVYGSNLQGHYNAMRSSMMAFGMRITDISMESGASDFIDIEIDY